MCLGFANLPYVQGFRVKERLSCVLFRTVLSPWARTIAATDRWGWWLCKRKIAESRFYLVWELSRRLGRRDHVQGRRVQRLLSWEKKQCPIKVSHKIRMFNLKMTKALKLITWTLKILPGVVTAKLARCSAVGRNEKEGYPIDLKGIVFGANVKIIYNTANNIFRIFTQTTKIPPLWKFIFNINP